MYKVSIISSAHSSRFLNIKNLPFFVLSRVTLYQQYQNIVANDDAVRLFAHLLIINMMMFCSKKAIAPEMKAHCRLSSLCSSSFTISFSIDGELTYLNIKKYVDE